MVFHFEERQGERGTWAGFTCKGSWELLGPVVKNPSFLTPFSPLRDAMGVFNIPSGLNLILCLQERRQELQGGESPRERFRGKRETTPALPPNTCSVSGLPQWPPPLLGMDWTQLCLVYALLTRWQPVVGRESVEYPASAFPQGPFSSPASKCCSVESSGNKIVFVA